MQRANQPERQVQTGSVEGLGRAGGCVTQEADSRGADALESSPGGGPPAGRRPEIQIGKATRLVEQHDKLVEAEVFTMTLGRETIELLPLKTWAQLDVHKWRVQGKLPGTPAGLEITPEHVKIAGESVAIQDPAGCAKLERLLAQWMALERETQLMVRKARQFQTTVPAADNSGPVEQGPFHFKVELDKRGQVHIRCLQGKEALAFIGLTPAGFSSLFSQGFMARPRSMSVGALHDWIQLDGELCSFEHGNDDSSKLEALLNQHYLPTTSVGQGKDVVVYANAASSTGFDIQFPVQVAGIVDHRRRPLNEETLTLLQDPEKSGVLHRDLIVKLARPSLIFKLKTPDGGERYLDRTPENVVHVLVDGVEERVIDLSQPVNCNRLSALDLTAVFNHPAIHRHSKLKASGNGPTPPAQPAASTKTPSTAIHSAKPASAPIAAPNRAPAEVHAAATDLRPQAVEQGTLAAAITLVAKASEFKPAVASQVVKESMQVVEHRPSPNLWLKEILAQTPLRHDWLGCLVYTKLAERFGNSSEGRFGPNRCWFAALGPATDLMDPRFVGVFLTEKGGLGVLARGREARFHNGVAFIGPKDSPLQGINVKLLGVGLDAQERLVFVVADNFRSKFSVADSVIAQELAHLKTQGASILGADELLASSEPIETLWTVPAQQANPEDPQAVESRRPLAASV